MMLDPRYKSSLMEEKFANHFRDILIEEGALIYSILEQTTEPEFSTGNDSPIVENSFLSLMEQHLSTLI